VDGSEVKLPEQIVKLSLGSASLSGGSTSRPEVTQREDQDQDQDQDQIQVSTRDDLYLKSPGPQQSLDSSSDSSSDSDSDSINTLQIEMSQTTQTWMNEVIADAERPLTQEINILTLEEHSSSSKSKMGALWLSVLVAIVAAVVFSMNITEQAPPPKLSLDVDKHDIEKVNLEPSVTMDISPQIKTPAEEAIHATVSKSGLKSTRQKITKTDTLKDLTQALSAPEQSKIDAITGLEEIAKAERVTQDQRTSSSAAQTKAQTKVSAQRTRSKTSKKAKSAITSKPRKKSTRRATTKKSKKTQPKKRVSSKSRTTKKKSRPKRARGEGLSKSTISGFIQQRAGGLRSCYQKVLKRDPEIGRVRTNLNFIIGTEGRVSRSTIRLSRKYKNSRLEKCIQNIVTRWYFPKASGESKVRYPLNLSPGF
jgi:hypothetical protein